MCSDKSNHIYTRSCELNRVGFLRSVNHHAVSDLSCFPQQASKHYYRFILDFVQSDLMLRLITTGNPARAFSPANTLLNPEQVNWQKSMYTGVSQTTALIMNVDLRRWTLSLHTFLSIASATQHPLIYYSIHVNAIRLRQQSCKGKSIFPSTRPHGCSPCSLLVNIFVIILSEALNIRSPVLHDFLIVGKETFPPNFKTLPYLPIHLSTHPSVSISPCLPTTFTT